MPSFTRSLLRGAEWSDLTSYMSPALLDVVSPAATAEFTTSLLRGRMDTRGAAADSAERAALLSAARAPVYIAAQPGPPMATARATPAERAARGDAILRLYFHQLVSGGPAFLDLRPARFGAAPTPARWRPGWARHRWRADFLPAIRDLYAGFYDDEPTRFDAALAPLGVAPARQIFLDHFSDDPGAVRFEAPHFRETFHAAFVACRDAGSTLHPDFLPLGLMLASLYAHLEPLDVPLDVRAAWRASVDAAPPRKASA